MEPLARAARSWPVAVLRSLVAGAMAVVFLLSGVGRVAATLPADLPRPEPGTRVVDPDGVLAATTRDALQSRATDLEARSRAQVVFVVTVTDGRRPTPDDARRAATALIDRWGVGRRGVNDGIVVLVMLDATRCHGGAEIQVGRGVLDAWFSGSEAALQALYEDAMEPRLRSCDIDGAMLEVAAALRVRAIRAGILAAPDPGPGTGIAPADHGPLAPMLSVAAALLVGLVALAWWWREERRGAAAPGPGRSAGALPPGLSPALGATLRARGFSDDAFAAALLDRAAHGQIRFGAGRRRTEEPADVLLVQPHLLTSHVNDQAPRPSPSFAPPVQPLPDVSDAESEAERAFATDLDRLFAEAGGALPAIEAFRLAPARRALGAALERELVDLGLLRRTRQVLRLAMVPAGIAVGVAGLAMLSAANAGMAAAWLLAGALVAVPLALIGLVARPGLTGPGAAIVGDLGTLRERLGVTLSAAADLPAAAATIRDAGIAGLGTPERVVVWATALGLKDELGQLLWRTAGRPDDRQPTPLVSTSWWWPLSRVLVFQMLVQDLGGLMGGAPGDHAGLFDAIPGEFGGGISLGGGGGGGSF